MSTICRTTVVALCLMLLRAPGSAQTPMKIGVWIVSLRKCGNVEAIVARAVKARLSYMVVKTHDVCEKIHGRRDHLARWYRHCPRQLFISLINQAHRAGIKVYAWGYVYPWYITAQQTMIRQSLDAGADGYVFDAEAEFCQPRVYHRVVDLCRPVLTYRNRLYPGRLLLLSTFARSDRGAGAQFPYARFGVYCDQVWTQSYWKDFRWSPDYTVCKVKSDFQTQYGAWAKNPRLSLGIKPIVQTGQAYKRAKRIRYVAPSELALFLETARENGYNEANVWVWELMGEEHWQVISQFTASPTISEPAPKTSTDTEAWAFGLLFTLACLYVLPLVIRYNQLVAWDERQPDELKRQALRSGARWPIDLYRWCRSFRHQ